MTNPFLKGMVKIGYARNVEARRKQLSTTALPTDYEVYATYEDIVEGCFAFLDYCAKNNKLKIKEK